MVIVGIENMFHVRVLFYTERMYVLWGKAEGFYTSSSQLIKSSKSFYLYKLLLLVNFNFNFL